MISAEIQYNLDQLASKFREYGKLARKTENEVLAKQGSKLAWNIYRGLRAIAPAKGSIRAQQIENLKAGKGVNVRPSVQAEIASKYGVVSSIATGQTYLEVRRGKKVLAHAHEILKDGKMMNLEALMVQREINLRESGRGFSGLSVPRPAVGFNGEQNQYAREIDSRYGFQLSDFTFVAQGERKYVELKWLGKHAQYSSPVEGLETTKQQEVLNEAIKATSADMNEYIERKIGEDLKTTHLN